MTKVPVTKLGSARRPYVRPMGAWWRRDPFFMRYMWREATALAVAAYAVVLLLGVIALWRGELAWRTYVECLRSPWAVIAHAVMLVAMVFHSYSWFEIMPKTMPLLFWGDKRVSATTITRVGLAAAVLSAAALFAVVWRLAT